jgi:hypothetical protein
MEVRRTLKDPNPIRELKPSELKIGYCVHLTDSDHNSDTLFVEKISDTEIAFKQKISPDPYRIILTRQGDKLKDMEGHSVTIRGKAKQDEEEL